MLKRRALTQLFAAASLVPAVGRAQGRSPLTRIAFGSCAEQRRPQPIWDAVLAYHPDLFIFAGDNVYGDFAPLSRWTQAGLRSRRPNRRLSRLRKGCRISRSGTITIWAERRRRRLPHKAVAKEEFLSFWNVPADDVRRTREGIYSAHVIGPPGMRVQVILLDLRWFRSPLKPTDRRDALGKEQ